MDIKGSAPKTNPNKTQQLNTPLSSQLGNQNFAQNKLVHLKHNLICILFHNT